MPIFGALKYRNYRLFLAGQIISLSGTWMQRVAQGWLVYELTNSAFALGIVGFATRLPVIFLSLFAGVLADRINKRNILIVSQTVAMFQALLLAWLTLSGRVQYWHVVILGTLLGATQSFDAPTRHSFFKDMVGEKDLMSAIALNSSAFNTARLVGPAIAGILIYTLGIGACFLINAISFIAVIAAYVAMRLETTTNRTGKSSWEDLTEGLRYVKGHPIVQTAVTLIALASILTFSYATLLPVFANRVLGGEAEVYASMMTAVGAGAMISALVLASLGNVSRKGLLASSGVLAFPLSLLMLSFARTSTAAYVLCFVTGCATILLTATMNSLVQTAIEDRYRGRVMSLYVLVFLGPLPFGNLIAGKLADTIGVIATLRLGTSISLAIAILILSLSPYFVRFRTD